MTAYCTPKDLQDSYKPIEEDQETFSPDYLSRFIERAQTRIDNKLRPHYKVPLTQVPAIIKEIAVDWALALVCEQHFSGIMYREETPLAAVFRKRAEDELEDVLQYATIDGLPGVVKHVPDVPEMRKRVATTTPGTSPLQGRLRAFDDATRGNSMPGRWPY
jgi:hypothetical protein